MYKIITKLKDFSENPFLNTTVALLALFSGIYETIDELIEHQEFIVGSHHGIILIAILHLLKTIPHLHTAVTNADVLINKDDKDQ